MALPKDSVLRVWVGFDIENDRVGRLQTLSRSFILLCYDVSANGIGEPSAYCITRLAKKLAPTK